MEEFTNTYNIIKNVCKMLRGGYPIKEMGVYKDISHIAGNSIANEEYGRELEEAYEHALEKAVLHEDYFQAADILDAIAVQVLYNGNTSQQMIELQNFCNIKKLQEDCENYIHEIYKAYNHNPDRNMRWFTGKGAYVTAITGNYEDLKDPEIVEEDMDYICFTDGKLFDSRVWKTIIIENPNHLDSIRLARYCKIMTYKLLPQYDYTIWIDGKIQVIGDVPEYISRYARGSSILCFPHFQRDCIYEEGDVCILVEKGKKEEIIPQMEYYRQLQYPEHQGLIDSGFLVKSHKDPALNQVMDDWWNEILNHSTRDQLSFNYICYKNGFHYDISNQYIYNNEYIHMINGH